MDADDPSAFADLLGQGVQRAGAERLHLRIERLGHLLDLALGDVLDAELFDQLVYPPR
ncbi:hypothetical protein GCM10020219_049100 [Nonomuraea dietziae]